MQTYTYLIYLYHNFTRVGTKLYYCILKKIVPKFEPCKNACVLRNHGCCFLHALMNSTGSDSLKNSVSN